MHRVNAVLDLGMLIGDGFEQDKGAKVGQGEKKSQGRKEKREEEKEIRVLTGGWRGMRQRDLTEFGFGWISK